MNKIKTPKHTIGKSVEKLRPIDDTFTQKLGENKDFCEELLRVVLNNSELKIISNTTQKTLHNIDTRSVTIDIKCICESGTIFGVEVQKSNNDDHQKRVRYNSSCIQIQSLEKRSSFKELPDVCMIYITETDFLRRGKTIYHIDRIIRETGEVITNGYTEIYINSEIDDGSALAEYMKIFKSETVSKNQNFPVICRLTEYYKHGEGRKNMCEIVENYAKACMREQAIAIAIKSIKKGYSNEDIIDLTGLSLEEIEELKTTSPI